MTKFSELKLMPLNTSLIAPPIEAEPNALGAFSHDDLHIDPEDEIVSGI